MSSHTLAVIFALSVLISSTLAFPAIPAIFSNLINPLGTGANTLSSSPSLASTPTTFLPPTQDMLKAPVSLAQGAGNTFQGALTNPQGAPLSSSPSLASTPTTVLPPLQDILKAPVSLAQGAANTLTGAVTNPQGALNNMIGLPQASVQLATDTAMQSITFAQDIATEGGIQGIFKETVRRTIQDIKRNIEDALGSSAKYMIQLLPPNVREVALKVINQFLFMMSHFFTL